MDAIADNVTVDNGALADYDVATDEDGSSKHHQYVKVEFGADGTFTKVSSTNPLPVSVSDGGNSLTIDGTVQVSDGGNSLTVDGTVQISDGGNSITVDGTVAATQSGTWTVIVSDGGNSITVDGAGSGTQYTEGDTDSTITGTAVLWEDTSDTLRAVSAAKPFPVAIISGAGSGGTAIQDDTAFTPATTQVTPAGAMFDDVAPDSVDEGDAGVLRMSANRNLYTTIRDAAGNERGVNVTAGNALLVSVSDGGNSITVDGTVQISDGGNSLTVDGTVQISDGGNSITVDGTVAISDGGNSITVDMVDSSTSGNLTGTGSVTLSGLNGMSAVAVDITNTWSATLQFEGSVDASNFFSVNAIGLSSGSVNTSTTSNGRFTIDATGLNVVRVRCSAFTSGTISIALRAGQGSSVVYLSAPLPSGTNTLGTVLTSDGGNSITVDGTVAATQSGTWTVLTSDGGNSLTIDGTVQISDGGNSITVDGTVAATQSGTWTVITSDGGNSLTIDGTVITSDGGNVLTVDGTGTFVTQENGAALTALQLLDDTVFADDAAFTIGTSKVTMAGFTVDESSTDSADEGDAVAARATADRKQIVTNYVHAAAGGATPHQNLDVDETEDDVKTSPGKVFWVHAMNLSTGKRYLKFYNATAANTTVGSTTPVLTFPIPTMGDTNGAGFTINFGDVGVQFDTAICIAATTGFAVADTGAPGTNDVIVNLGYA